MAMGAVYGVTTLGSHDVWGCKGLEAAAPFRMGFFWGFQEQGPMLSALKGGANSSSGKKKTLKSSEAVCLFEMVWSPSAPFML